MLYRSLRISLAVLCSLFIAGPAAFVLANEDLTGEEGAPTASDDGSGSGSSGSDSVSLHLEQYQMIKGPIELDPGYTWVDVAELTPEWAGVRNISGLSYNRTRNSLFLVMNDPCYVLEFDLRKNEVQRYIYLDGFDDTEDLVWLNNNRFAIVEERRQNLVLINLPTMGSFVANLVQSVDYKNGVKYNIDPVDAGNVGLEGVTFDSLTKRFFVVKEKTPSKLYEVTEPTFGVPTVTNPFDLDANNFGCTDFSGIHYEPKSKHFLILSDEGKAVIETTQDGTEVSRLSLSGLQQPEGIAMGPDGTLYIASEPSSLYFFRKP
jgi:uncharacterized protein YjiK